jgi:hypothetical protein
MTSSIGTTEQMKDVGKDRKGWKTRFHSESKGSKKTFHDEDGE